MQSARQILPLAALLFLSGCASTNAKYYTQAVQSWQGGQAQALIKTWGVPDNRLTNPAGNTVLVYKKEKYSSYNTTASPSVGVSYAAGHPVITTTPSTNNSITRGAMSLMCTTLFEVNAKGMIIDTLVQGNGCFSSANAAEKLAKKG